ncbi:MAG: 2-hydroxyacid dehydrogenase [Anaerolineales bacterium]|jgi:glyoxylate reductase
MNERPIVLMTHPLPAEWIGNDLDGFEVILEEGGAKGIQGKLQEYLPRAAGILCLLDDPLPESILNSAQNLRVISSMAVGVDNIDIAACTRRGIPVGHTPGVLTDGTADLTLALLLSVSRLLTAANNDAREGRWAGWNPTGWLGADFNGSTAGILGMGKIGSAVARRLAGFGCRILFTNRSSKPELARELNAEQVDLDTLLIESDFLCLHISLTDETRGLINGEAFQKMKSSAILVNAARGQVVDTKALLDALQTGQIRAAGLDVTDPEPLPPDHPLYQLENCLITPHIGSATYGTRRRMAQIALNNLRYGILGKKLEHCANPEVYIP